jgi:hypothetical protein
MKQDIIHKQRTPTIANGKEDLKRIQKAQRRNRMKNINVGELTQGNPEEFLVKFRQTSGE